MKRSQAWKFEAGIMSSVVLFKSTNRGRIVSSIKPLIFETLSRENKFGACGVEFERSPFSELVAIDFAILSRTGIRKIESTVSESPCADAYPANFMAEIESLPMRKKLSSAPIFLTGIFSSLRLQHPQGLAISIAWRSFRTIRERKLEFRGVDNC
jgi:hypothetical protein